jgi:hypothetical protein
MHMVSHKLLHSCVRLCFTCSKILQTRDLVFQLAGILFCDRKRTPFVQIRGQREKIPLWGTSLSPKQFPALARNYASSSPL